MKINKTSLHIIYWIFVMVFLILIYGWSWGSFLGSFYFISLLLPVIIGTSYFVNYFLVPRYLFKKKYLHFILYSIYTIIFSLFFETAVFIFTFTYYIAYNYGNINRNIPDLFHFNEINPNAKDTLLLALVMYIIVFLTTIILITKQLIDNQKEITRLNEDMSKLKHPFLQIISQRKPVRIPYDDILYIESYSDSINIISKTNKEIRSKERLTTIEKKLPNTFLRIHRSFIVNLKYITGFNYDEVEISGTTLNIGRTYKTEVHQILNDGNKLSR